MKKAFYLLLGLCMAMTACKPDGPNEPNEPNEQPTPSEETIAEGTCGENLTWKLTIDSVLTISGTGAMTDYSSGSDVPWDSHRGAIKIVVIEDGVTSIGSDAFYGCRALAQVTIPNSVTSIGIYAFGGCSTLTQVTIPEGVTSIGSSAFWYCTALTEINVESGNTAYCSEDGVLFNKGKTTLEQYPEGKQETTYIIPSSVTSIGEGAFLNCSALTQVTIPESVTIIDYHAFSGCSALTQITIPSSVTWIRGYVFNDCKALTAIHVESGNTDYCSEDGVLFDKDKTHLKQYPAGKPDATYAIPNSVTSIGGYAFSDCSALTEVTIGSSVTSIGRYAFFDCSSLTQITIPKSVTWIEVGAFSGCRALAQVTIPESVTSIGDIAFYGCTTLDEMTVLATTPPTIGGLTFSEVDKSIPVYVPAGSVEAYKAADGWSEFTNIQAIP